MNSKRWYYRRPFRYCVTRKSMNRAGAFSAYDFEDAQIDNKGIPPSTLLLILVALLPSRALSPAMQSRLSQLQLPRSQLQSSRQFMESNAASQTTARHLPLMRHTQQQPCVQEHRLVQQPSSEGLRAGPSYRVPTSGCSGPHKAP